MSRYKHPLYPTWKKMRLRCRSQVNAAYANYGGRGIKICKRWDDFLIFAKDMGMKPSPTHTLDRINNDGNYSPKNCRWATKTQQANNRRTPRRIPKVFFDFNGKSLPLFKWAKLLGVNRSRLSQRIYVYKWPIEKALTI